MNNNIIYWTIGVAVLLGLGVVGFVILQTPATTPSQGNTPSQSYSNNYNNNSSVTTQPGSQTPVVTKSKFTVLAQGGVRITVKDFLNNGETATDMVNPGTYYLAGSIGYCLANGTCPSGYKSDEFLVTFNTNTQSFNISLLKEPLSTARQDVEKFLIDRLGASQEQMCALTYYVRTSESVNPVFAGQNLGFSFCPGAIKLP